MVGLILAEAAEAVANNDSVALPGWAWSALSAIIGAVIVGLVIRSIDQIDKRAEATNKSVEDLDAKVDKHREDSVREYNEIKVKLAERGHQHEEGKTHDPS